jgi:hypothetical protein
LAFSYWIDYLGFITEGKLAAIFIKPSLGVFQLAGHLLHIPTSTRQQKFSVAVAEIEEEASTSSSPRHQQVFWCRCRGKRRLLYGEFRTHILYSVLSFALLYFYLLRFIENTKKLVSFVFVISLLLIHYVIP